MLSFPAKTTRVQKMNMIEIIKKKLLATYEGKIMAIGAYGSVGWKTDRPYSDIEHHIVTENGFRLQNLEFVYKEFKIELSMNERNELLKKAGKVDESWPITAGVYMNILPIYDPNDFFEELKKIPFKSSDEVFKEVMREFMIWEPYETIAKLRNNAEVKNDGYIPLGAKDLTWQTAKLIGLANKKYFSTKVKTLEEAISMDSKPSGFRELAVMVMEGKLSNKAEVYQNCEDLWEGLNEWFCELDIEYQITDLPF
ncbi:kanamycin nucleotidyltransferase C-terminal domain-containing protein [Peribacillus frigoritolerans]|uniref:kanamycin nucleotidyltransferase C-terminal domain-containing protein n=1 Tax=Peribacillus frigoritolerans TaxID=450367 RepID=UPI001059F92A|nr:kanamycin nucleotidyltransferase C-terminal domain-containing protein [Peribacillus frigoritolerans]TDL82720.1 KNTase domain-containing protein [Peribacillus frigoritolerans]